MTPGNPKVRAPGQKMAMQEPRTARRAFTFLGNSNQSPIFLDASWHETYMLLSLTLTFTSLWTCCLGRELAQKIGDTIEKLIDG